MAICEQAESPEEAKKRGNKGPLKRAVVRIVTPGTLIEDDFLPPRENNFLAALGSSGGSQALAWVDLSTGAFSVEALDQDRLEEALVRLAAAELIASDHPAADHPFTDADGHGLVGSVALRPATDFDSSRGERMLKDLYGVSTLDGIARLDRAELAAAAAIIARAWRASATACVSTAAGTGNETARTAASASRCAPLAPTPSNSTPKAASTSNSTAASAAASASSTAPRAQPAPSSSSPVKAEDGVGA